MSPYDWGALAMVALCAVYAVGAITADAIRRKSDAKGRNGHGRRVAAHGQGAMAPWGVS